jgi:hypothetical protein
MIPNSYGELVLQPAEKAFGSSGEMPALRRRTFDVPSDAPPEKVRITLRAEVEYSLRDVCGNWPTGEFDRIVADVTATAMKYHGRERRGKKSVSFLARVTRIPGAAPVIAAVMAAVNSVQRFLHLETLPLN